VVYEGGLSVVFHYNVVESGSKGLSVASTMVYEGELSVVYEGELSVVCQWFTKADYQLSVVCQWFTVVFVNHCGCH